VKLPHHGRFDYSAIVERPDYSWPNGKRLAVHVATNLEHFAFGEGMGHTPTEPGPPPDHRNYAWRDYGLRVGIWRILDLLDDLQLPASHLTNSVVYDYAPQIMDRIRTRDDEIVGHGRTNSERQADFSEADEAVLIREATEVIKRHEGKSPRGWMSPWISESDVTADLLKENGYTYIMNWPCEISRSGCGRVRALYFRCLTPLKLTTHLPISTAATPHRSLLKWRWTNLMS
jgi:hypothetical protein